MAEPDINAVLGEKGLEFQLGLDVATHWVTGAQAFVNPDFTMIVFREQTVARSMSTGQDEYAVKNAVRLIMPTAVAGQIRDMLQQAISPQVSQDGQS